MTLKKAFSVSLTAILFLFITSHAQAANITPTTFDDFYDGANCSLRNAVQSFNNGGEFGGCTNTGGAFGTGDTITLEVGTYLLTIPGNNENSNTTGDLDVNAVDIIINGAGSDQTTIDASGISDSDRIIDLSMVENATITGLRMTGGDVSNLDQGGGAIRAFTLFLTLDDVHLFRNASNQGGGLVATCAPSILNSVVEENQITQGNLPTWGGGIFHLFTDICGADNFMTIENSWIIGNMAIDGPGGGVAVDASGGAMRMNNSTVDGNTATYCGGGIFNAANSVSSISYSTISRNESLMDGGGGVCDDASYFFLTNSTVSNNQSDGDGGGIRSQGGLKGMYNVTVAFNQVNRDGGFAGGVQRNENSSDNRFDIQVYNTIIAQNTADNRPDCEGGFGSGGYNLIGNNGEGDPGECQGFTNGVMGDQVGSPGSAIDPQLGPLQLNGGTTETHALALTSPAVDRGNNMTGCQALDTALFFDTDTVQFNDLSDDQRFFTRPIAILDPNDPICDIGAFELQTFSFQVTKDDGLGGNSIEVNNNFTYTISMTNNGPGDAASVTLSDPLPAQVSFVSLTTSQGTCAEAGSIVSCDLGTILVGGTVTVTITVTALTAGDAVNTVTVATSLEDLLATITTVIVDDGTPFVQGSGCALNKAAPSPAWPLMSLLAFLAVLVFWKKYRQV